MLKKLIFTSTLIIALLNINISSILAEDVVKGHNWKMVHSHKEEKLVDTYKKKVKTIAYHHYHDVHVYRTFQVLTYYCSIHDEFRTVLDISNKREEEQKH